MKTKIIILSILAICSLNLFSTSYIVNTSADSGAGSLRQAITDANASSSTPHTITFGGSYNITLLTALPGISKTTTIDGGANTINIVGYSASASSISNTGLLTLTNLTFDNLISSYSANTTATNCTFKNTANAVKVNAVTFSATNCIFDSNSGSATSGASVTTLSSTAVVQLSGCTITNNTGVSAIHHKGGAGSLSITNCTISGNTSASGAAIYDVGNGAGTLTISNSIISNNTNTSTSIYGGGIGGGAATTITNCQISGNTASRGGGIALLVGGSTAKSSLAMTGCTVSGNYLGQYVASAYGGGIYIQGGTSAYTDNCTFTNCTISGNSTPVLNVTTTASAGGGVHIGGGGNSSWTPVITFSNCTIYGNNVQGNPISAISGGGIDRTNGTAVINYCIILNNNSNSTAGGRNINAAASWSTSTTGRNMYEGSASWNSSTITGNVTQSGNYTWSEILNTTLADNGGSTALPDGSYVKTHALVAGTSLQTAIDPDATGLSGLQTTDQRGTGRDALPDMGAYESMLPGVPTAVTVTRNNVSGQLSVAFTAPSVSTKGGASISNYKYSTDGGSTFTALSSPQTTSPFIISGLTNGTTYNVQIRAVNSNGDGVPCVSKTGTPNVATISGATTATAFTTTYGTASAPQSFSISGANLLGAITATAPTGFEVSSDGTSYATTATYTRSLIDFTASGTVYIRLKATATVSGTYNSINIVLSTTGATSVNITTSASGNVVSPATGSIAAGNLSSPGLTDAELANTDLTLSSGEFIIDATKTVRSLTIAPGAKLTHSSGTLTATNGITLESDATGTATLVDNTTNAPQAITATVQQYVTSGRNWYMSIPLASGASSLLSRGTSVVCYDEPTSAWVAPTAGTLNKLRGYIQKATASPLTGSTGTVDFTGIVNTGAHSITLSRTTGQTGFNLVGNPYPSYLDWNLVTKTNVSNTMWYRTKEGGVYKFYTYVANSGAGVGSPASITNKIPPMQAFWVRVNTVGTGSIGVDNNMRAHKDVAGNIMKAPNQTPQKLIRLQVSNGVNTDETVLYFNANASDAFDQFDAPKRSNEDLAIPEIFTQVGSEQLVINGMKDVMYNAEIPLGFRTLTAASNNNLSISANEMTNFETGTRLFLIDKQNPSVETELTKGAAYSFSAPVTAPTTNRFSLLFRAPGGTTGIDNTSKLNVQVFVNAANQITIIAPEKSNYAIYNAVGQVIENGLTTSNLQTSNVKLASGVYVVQVYENGRSNSTRVILNGK